MSDPDPWAGLIDPRAALAAARRALAGSSTNFSNSCESVSSKETETCAQLSQISSFSKPPVVLKQNSGKSTKDRKENCSSSLSNTYEHSASPAGSLAPDSECVGDIPSAKAANPLKHGSTHSDRSTIALADPAKAFTVANTVPSPTAHLSGPLAWRDGLARLDRWTPPCEGFRSGEWEAVHRAVAHFMDHLAAEAEARGWTAIDLFGVHGRAGATRVDSCGALMLPLLRNATALTSDAITFGPLTYRRRAMPEAVLVWDFVGETA